MSELVRVTELTHVFSVDPKDMWQLWPSLGVAELDDNAHHDVFKDVATTQHFHVLLM